MHNDERTKVGTDIAERVARLIGQTLAHLRDEHGIPYEIVLAGAHAEIISQMTAHFGGDYTASECTTAATFVSGMPPVGSSMPVGRA